MAKAESEVYSYRVAEENGFDAMSILPCHVIGPLLAADHNKGYSWQWCIGKMMEGGEYFKNPDGRMLWNCVDVRDTARAHRLCMQSETIPNGSRYCLVASDRSGELFTHELQAELMRLYP
jgi:nucleoside-diphosphate-sugar epimerase